MITATLWKKHWSNSPWQKFNPNMSPVSPELSLAFSACLDEIEHVWYEHLVIVDV